MLNGNENYSGERVRVADKSGEGKSPRHVEIPKSRNMHCQHKGVTQRLLNNAE
jgi:hypothetical protein